MVLKFLHAGNTVKAEYVVDLMYSSRESGKKPTWNVNVSTNDGTRIEDSGADPIFMPPSQSPKIAKARHAKLTEWAIQKIVSKDAEELSGKKGGFRLKTADVTCEFIHDFSPPKFASVAHKMAPTVTYSSQVSYCSRSFLPNDLDTPHLQMTSFWRQGILQRLQGQLQEQLLRQI
jgi:hypothetical protein